MANQNTSSTDIASSSTGLISSAERQQIGAIILKTRPFEGKLVQSLIDMDYVQLDHKGFTKSLTTFPELKQSALKIALSICEYSLDGQNFHWRLTYHSRMVLANRKILSPITNQLGEKVMLKESAGKNLLTYPDFLKFTNILLTLGVQYKHLNSKGVFDVNQFLAYLYRLPGLEERIASYVSSGGDIQLTRSEILYAEEILIPSEEVLADVRSAHRDQTEAYIMRIARSRVASERVKSQMGNPTISGRMTESELTTFASMMILCSVKSFISDQHLVDFLKKRITALTAHCAFEDVSWESLNSQFNLESFKLLGDKLAYYPKLKQQVFLSILDINEPWATHCKTILEDAQLTTFNFVHRFLTTAKPTRAHFTSIILDEIKNFIEVYKGAKERYGEHLKYAKLIDPTDTSMASGGWGTLASLSIYHAYLTSSAESLIRFRVKNKLSDALIEMFTCVVDDRYLLAAKIETVSLAEEERKFMGLKENFDPSQTEAFRDIDVAKLNTLRTFIEKAARSE